MFRANWVFPHVVQITDAMGVSFTLIEGSQRAVLFDTGYGTENAAAYVSTLTAKPVKVILSHGHHDHVLGARWFAETFLCAEDADEFRLRTGTEQRRKVKRQAEEGGVAVPPDFLDAGINMPQAVRFYGQTGPFESVAEDLGGLEIQVIHVPGHTPGSLVIHVPEYGLLLTGDNWNPCTWMWFPTSLSADRWRENMLSLIRTLEDETGKETGSVLCSHQPMLREGREMKNFLAYMTDERMKSSPAADTGTEINVHIVEKKTEGWSLLFDYDKLQDPAE